MGYRIFFKTLLLTGFFSYMTGNALRAQNARIKIDLDRTIGEVNKHIYGNFVEHLGRCVYGGIYDTASALSDKNGFRKDVMTAVYTSECPTLSLNATCASSRPETCFTLRPQ